MNEHYEFVNPPLPYSYSALEPYIDEKTMMLHHNRHLQTYVDNLNNILKDYPQLQDWSLEQLLYYTDYLPADIQTPVVNNAGGVYNHIFYFSNLTDSSTKAPVGELSNEIDSVFGDYDSFKEKFTQAALSVFGSGYAWLTADANRGLKIITTKNQDTPIPLELYPVLNIDVWEHAYYLKHYNLRKDYINDWFEVVNWNNANQLYNRLNKHPAF